jgi:DNA processing protein
LIEVFGSPHGVWGASYPSLIRIEGIGQALAHAILSCRVTEGIRREYQRVLETGATLVALTDANYPPLLRAIYDPPSLLYVRGRLRPESRAIAIVGSRKATTYGRMITERFSRLLTEEGFIIVSGMARGIDGFAHRGALQGGGETLAVLGCGVDVVYPPEHKGLMAQIEERGGILSEYSLGTEPGAEHFPQRNRIISGLALGTLVVEATGESGSLITARFALEQGREVFAIPGNVGMKTSEGTNLLIKSGAKLVQGVEDILEELAPEFRRVGTQAKESSLLPDRGKAMRAGLGADEVALYDLVGSEPMHIDELCMKSRFPSQKVSSLLLALEFKGAVRQMAGHFYMRTI